MGWKKPVISTSTTNLPSRLSLLFIFSLPFSRALNRPVIPLPGEVKDSLLRTGGVVMAEVLLPALVVLVVGVRATVTTAASLPARFPFAGVSVSVVV